MRVDAHQHFWHYNDSDYVWMTGELGRLARHFGPEDLRPLLDAAGIDATIAVQARQMLEENDYLLDIADRHDWVLGVVGWVDFESDDVDAQLDRYAAHPKFRGVRELIHDMPDDEYATSDAHLAGVARLAPRGLSYDLLLRPQHIGPAMRLVDRLPDQPFVVDHIAKPRIAAGELHPWAQEIGELARRANVCCKLSGMVTEADWDSWGPADLRPYIDVCLEAFGPDRLMLGSDWPVCTCAGDYERVVSVVIDYVSNLSPDEQEAILGGTCLRFYGLETPKIPGGAHGS
ncbi:MAG: amidohydrolase family protein [Spirochaetota bacterium]